MSSRLRPTLHNTSDAAPDEFDSLYMIRDSVERRAGLLWGKLNDSNGNVCAIGAFFADNDLPLKTKIVDEVAAYNDSIPHGVSRFVRRNKVLKWLTRRLAYLECRRGPSK